MDAAMEQGRWGLYKTSDRPITRNSGRFGVLGRLRARRTCSRILWIGFGSFAIGDEDGSAKGLEREEDSPLSTQVRPTMFVSFAGFTWRGYHYGPRSKALSLHRGWCASNEYVGLVDVNSFLRIRPLGTV